MLSTLCAEMRNYFKRSSIHGKFTISGGEISGDALPASYLKPGQYYRILNSTFNDGVWKYGEDALKDETFDGSIWALAIPAEVIALSEEIDAWVGKYGNTSGPYTSETLGEYSYTKSEKAQTWQGAFATRINAWRKI